MMNEKLIKILLDDLYTVYMVGYQREDLDTEAEKWGQIQILEYILDSRFNEMGVNQNG